MNIVESLLDKPTLSNEELARKYDVDIREIEKRVEQGAKVEHEHTSDEEVAREIARDHIGEKLDYYDLLKQVED